MKYFLLLATAFAFQAPLQAQCISCYSLEDALVQPATVEHLHLSNQGITALPEAFAQFHNLRTLDLSNNNLFAFPEFTMDFPQLTTVDLSNNPGFNTFTLDAFINGSPGVTQLNLSRNYMRYISPWIGNFRKLQQLDLSHNNLRYLPEPFQQLEKLEVLQLSHNELRELHLLTGTLWNLKDLDVSVNPELVLHSLVTSLSYMDGLETFRISTNVYTNNPGKELRELPVKHLVIVGPDITQTFDNLKNNPAVQQISFESCHFSNPDALIDALKGLPALTTLSFQKCVIPYELVQLEDIDTLLFSDCTMPEPKNLLKLKQLKNLDLSAQDLEPEMIALLQTDLPQTSVSGTMIPMDASMRSNDLSALVPIVPVLKEIDSRQPQVLQYENTQLDIPANGFMNENGSVYTGTVRIEVREYFDPITMALAGVPMVMNTGTKDELFSSNGMIEVNAEDTQGNALYTNPGAVIQVQIRDVQPQQNSNLYTFDTISKNWIQNAQIPIRGAYSNRLRRILDSLNQLNDTNFVNVQSIPAIIHMRFANRKLDPSELSFIYLDNHYRSKISGNTFYYYLKNHRANYIADQVWKVDTLVSPEYIALLKSIRKGQRKFENQQRKNRTNYTVMPRLIRDLEIRPDLERDHFVMSFRYKDSLVQFPVYLGGGDTKQQIKRQGKFFREHEKLAKKDAADLVKFRKSLDENIGKAATRIKEQIANNMIQIQNIQDFQAMGGMSQISSPYQEILTFGLESFGLVNCDYFSRNPPLAFLKLDKVVLDQNNVAVEVPASVRNIILKDNTYLASSRKIPFFGNGQSIIFFPNGPDELIVIRPSKNQFSASRVNILGKTAPEIRKLILNE